MRRESSLGNTVIIFRGGGGGRGEALQRLPNIIFSINNNQKNLSKATIYDNKIMVRLLEAKCFDILPNSLNSPFKEIYGNQC